MLFANRLSLPDSTRAILWDMDGVLIDSIGLDYEVCTMLVQQHVDDRAIVTRDLVQTGFALSPPDFWRFLLRELDLQCEAEDFNRLLSQYEHERRTASYPLNPGIGELLRETAQFRLHMAVVSNNHTDDIDRVLRNTGIRDWFDVIVGNDNDGLRKKPHPDAYLRAAQLLEVPIEKCAVIEDSLLGTEAGRRAGAYTVAVSTGGDAFDNLSASGNADICYTQFGAIALELIIGSVLAKEIATPNEFVSHMIEHIAWRIGASIRLRWYNDDWCALGKELASKISELERRGKSAAVIGMIDDGSAEILLCLDADPLVEFTAIGEIDLDHFLSLRSEQLSSGHPLRELIEGLVAGLGAEMTIRVCSIEDPHHTWEGIFRAIGIALSRVYGPAQLEEQSVHADLTANATEETAKTVRQGAGVLKVLSSSPISCRVVRETAESVVSVSVSVADDPECIASIHVSPTIDVSSFPRLLSSFAEASGLHIELDFVATRLSSSHVVLEDTALVLGTCLFNIIQHRMEQFGINGAGSSLQTVEDFKTASVAAAVSIEGRKFLKLVPFDLSYADFKRNVILGHNVCGTVRSEDIDDFLDALAGGMRASIMVHFRECNNKDSDELWQAAVFGVGQAVREAMAANGLRKGLPAGVKATLI